MRHTYVVSYDISDPKRLRKVYRLMLGYGEHLQLSVFRCDVSERELVTLRAELRALIHHGQDQVLFVNVGPADGRAGMAFSAMGRPYVDTEREAIVV